jgi:hypothetical protein
MLEPSPPGLVVPFTASADTSEPMQHATSAVELPLELRAFSWLFVGSVTGSGSA